MKTKNFEQLRSDYLRDLSNQQPAAHTHPGSDNYARATALATLAEGQYQHQEWILRQVFADTADTAYLERHCAMYRIWRKAAAAAAGSIRISGAPNTVLPAGLVAQVGDITYQTGAPSQTDGSGQVLIACHCLSTGAAGNQPDNTPAKLQSPPAGIEADAVLTSMVGGTDIESDAALLDRLLSRLRQPPAGGNAYDYYRWAMDVPGVEAAFVYPLRRGLGTVDVAILTASGLPSPDVVRAVQQYIDECRPVTAKNVQVVAPQRVPLNVSVRVSLADGYTLPAVKEAAERALSAYFATIKPGDTVYKSHIEALISDTLGVRDRVLDSPSANQNAAITPHIQWLALGTFEMTLL